MVKSKFNVNSSMIRPHTKSSSNSLISMPCQTTDAQAQAVKRTSTKMHLVIYFDLNSDLINPRGLSLGQGNNH